MTGCTASRYGDHDYSQPPHNTPDNPRDAPDTTACQARSAGPPFGACADERRYELTVFQPGTHDWIRLFACVPCTASLRAHRTRLRLGPGGTEGIARIRDAAGTETGPSAKGAPARGAGGNRNLVRPDVRASPLYQRASAPRAEAPRR